MGEMTLQQALNVFKTTYMPARNLAPRTRTEYANDLKDLIKFLAGVGVTGLGELNINNIDLYMARLDQLGLSGSTRKRKAITIRSFLSFLFRNGYISHDISEKVILPFSEQSIPRVLTQTEYQRLIQACSENIRDKAIVTLLLQTGIRLSELTRLNLVNIHLPESIDIVGNGNRKGRTVPINSKAHKALKAYISDRPSSIYNNLFLNNLGKPLGNRGVEKIILHHYRIANIFNASVQSLRHTFAVQHIIRGTNLKTIQKVMGHQDIRTTEIYLHLATDLSTKELEENSL